MKKGFTLIELLIVIAILGILATLISGNLINSLKRGRDAKRKEDLQQIQKAIELYYEDVKEYPTTLAFGQPLINPSVAGKIYMQKLPKDPSPAYTYLYIVESINGGSNNAYRIYTVLENDLDLGPGTKVDVANGKNISYDQNCCASGSLASCKCRFGIISYNNNGEL